MVNKRYTKDEIKFLLENVEKYGSFICAEKIGKSPISVQQKYYRLTKKINNVCHASEEEIKNLKFKTNILNLSLNFIESKSPRELAYFLGYFWADGYIDKNNNLKLEIISEDADNIKNIINKICTFNIYKRKRKNRKEQTTFYTSGINNGEVLKKLGKYPFSIENHKKIFDFIPEEYHKYFIRGLIDGDGNFYLDEKSFKENGYVRVFFSIAARFGQDWGFLIELLKKYGLEKTIAKNKKFKKTKGSIILNTNPNEIYKFIKSIYFNEDGIYLVRKFNKIKRIGEIINDKKNIVNI